MVAPTMGLQETGMAQDDDGLLFSDEEEAPVGKPPARTTRRPWKVLIVDDEDQIHTVTRMVLADFSFKDLPLEFLSAHSGQQAREILREHGDIAVVLLDVVMETDNAGLEVAVFIREELKNPNLRIILRTGQPGQAPERRVIVEYDINDYKEKSELTAQKLFSTMVTALRSYRDIMTIEMSRNGLEKIIGASASLLQIRSMETFLSGILMQIGSLLEMSLDAVLVSAAAGDRNALKPEDYSVVAASGRFADLVAQPAVRAHEPEIWHEIQQVMNERRSIYRNDRSVVYFLSRTNRDTVVYIETQAELLETDHNLVELFCTNASIGLDNLTAATS
jgi:CheY-like chemotaxis protein